MVSELYNKRKHNFIEENLDKKPPEKWGQVEEKFLPVHY